MKRLLIGLDGTDQAAHALEFTIDLAHSIGAEVIACHAIGKLTRFTDGKVMTLDQYRETIIQEFEDTWCKQLNESGVRNQKIVVDGNPITTLLEISKEERVDIIVLGSRSHNIDSFLSSTCHQLIEHSSIPVIIVPAKPG